MRPAVRKWLICGCRSMARPVRSDSVGMRWRRSRSYADMSPQVFSECGSVAALFKNSFYGSLMNPMVVPGSQVEQGPNMKRMICVSGTMFRQ